MGPEVKAWRKLKPWQREMVESCLSSWRQTYAKNEADDLREGRRKLAKRRRMAKAAFGQAIGVLIEASGEVAEYGYEEVRDEDN